MKMLIATFVAGLGLALLAALLWQDPDARSIRGGERETSRSTPSAASTPTASTTTTPPPRIVTTEQLYFGRPYETITIEGTYQGAATATTLRVQLRRPGGWTDFPLPVVTDEAGGFRAYVELGRGQYRLRIVDPATGLSSRVLKLLLL